MKKIYLVAPDKLGTIAPEIYGHFTEQIGGMFYDGLWVGKDSPIPNIRGFRKDLVEKLKAIRPPVLRWPGGCFAESYDWRDGIGENRPTRLSWWTGLDGRYESNAVGTHDFCDLCEIVGAKPYFAANLTSTTPQHIRDWMEYCLAPRGSTTLALEREKNGHPESFDIPYWGVGNENWGAGGNMRPEYYADECRRFGTIMHNVDKKAHLFACGTDAKGFDWALGVIPSLRKATHYIDGFAMHYYCRSPGGSVDYTDEEWDQQMVEYAQKHDLLYVNLLEKQEEIGIDWQKDTYDAGLHLNVQGAEKASAWFGRVLSQNCGVPDRRDDAALAAIWEEKRLQYENEKKEKLQ